MRVVGVIQARLGSSRLAFKMMLSLHGKPIIEWIIKRVQKSKLLDDLIVAIPVTEDNDILEAYLKKLGVCIYRGSEGDVLNRFYEAGKLKEATHIVRICADNPLICADEIDNLIEFYKNNPCDYAYNHIPKNNSYPDGFGAEIISFELLSELERVVTKQHHREHSLSYITENEDKFNIKTFEPKAEIAYPNLRFDIDTFDDYYKLSLKDFNIDATTKEIVDLFKEN